MPVNLVGVELEGAYLESSILRIYNEGLDLGSDNTAYPPMEKMKAQKNNPLVAGKELRFYGKLDYTVDMIRKYYPDAVGPKCGGHVHVSLDQPGEYMILMSRVFYHYFRTRLKRWAERNLIGEDANLFWPRFNGDNSYCCNFFVPEKQIRGDGHHVTHPDKKNGNCKVRYACLNYGWAKHRTIECRLLPMFDDRELYIKAVIEIVDIFNKFLKLHTEIDANKKSFTYNDKVEITQITEICKICV